MRPNAPAPSTAPALHVGGLGVAFGAAQPIRFSTLDVHAGEIVGLVGESGSGKSLTALAAIGLLPAGARTRGRVLVDGVDMLTAPEAQRRTLRGRRIALIFQNPMSALNPYFTIGEQIAAVVQTHFRHSRHVVKARVHEALDRVQLPVAAAAKYPHQMSGGQLQRAMIAMAVSCQPAVLIADEPTTALDVTVQARIMQLLRELTLQGMGLLVITHDLALIAQTAARVNVMYAGRIVESGPTREVFLQPAHPYTAGLLATQPELAGRQRRLPTIDGRVPPADADIAGCAFRERCPQAGPDCEDLPPVRWLGDAQVLRRAECHRPLAGLPAAATTVLETS